MEEIVKYVVWDGFGPRKSFDTLEEAEAYCEVCPFSTEIFEQNFEVDIDEFEIY